MFSYEGATSTFFDPRGMPEGWRVLVEAGSGELYFASDAEQCTTFVDPRGLPDNWQLRSSNGDVYFANTKTKDTSWRDPRDGVRSADRLNWYAHFFVTSS